MVRRSAEEMKKADRQTLNYIRLWQQTHEGQTPTYEQISIGLGLAGKSSVQRRLDRLKAQGLIRIESPKAPIEIVRK